MHSCPPPARTAPPPPSLIDVIYIRRRQLHSPRLETLHSIYINDLFIHHCKLLNIQHRGSRQGKRIQHQPRDRRVCYHGMGAPPPPLAWQRRATLPAGRLLVESERRSRQGSLRDNTSQRGVQFTRPSETWKSRMIGTCPSPIPSLRHEFYVQKYQPPLPLLSTHRKALTNRWFHTCAFVPEWAKQPSRIKPGQYLQARQFTPSSVFRTQTPPRGKEQAHTQAGSPHFSPHQDFTTARSWHRKMS